MGFREFVHKKPNCVKRYLRQTWADPICFVWVLVFVLLSICILPCSAIAHDVIRLGYPHSQLDRRHEYNHTVLIKALDETVETHGSYHLEKDLPATQRQRTLMELIRGRNINVHIVPTQKEWEEKTIPIRIPILKGLLSYRIFLINKSKQINFTEVQSLDDLKTLNAGLRQQWSTTQVLQFHGFGITTSSSYEGLFRMLNLNRFDYFPRGINEIFQEFDSRQKTLTQITIESSMALYLPMPTYIFVSPRNPEIAQRIETGLMKIIKDGRFDKLFYDYHGAYIERANLANRKIYSVDNPFLSSQTPFNKKNLWFTPMDNRLGNNLCTDTFPMEPN